MEFAVSNRDAVYSESVKRTLSKESNESIEMRLVWVCARLNWGVVRGEDDASWCCCKNEGRAECGRGSTVIEKF